MERHGLDAQNHAKPPGHHSWRGWRVVRHAQACIAVGNVVSNGHNNAFSEAWNGTAWTLKTTPRSPGTTYSLLNDASCRSATFCMATGDYQVNNSSKSRTLAERWNGKTWAIEATPNPKDGVNGDQLPGVACSSPLACVA